MPSPLSPAGRRRIEDQQRLVDAALRLRPGASVPYLAHMRISAEGREKDVLLGTDTRWTPELSMVDWRSAPLAEVFFGWSEGEAYALESEERTIEGVLLARSLVAFEGGRLVEIADAETVLSRRGGEWRELRREGPGLRPRPKEVQRSSRSPLDVVLDDAQEGLVSLPHGRTLLVLGEAGFGKTTVALHRLARLRKAQGPRFRAAVVVPTEGLRRLSETVLARLGVKDVDVLTYDRFAAAQARRAFRGLPRRESEGATAGVIRLKRHPALRAVLAEVARRAPERGEAPRRGGALVRRADLEHVFGDRDLMARVAEASGGAIGTHMVSQVLEHTRVQFSERTEVAWAHVDPERLATLDGREIDEGTPMGDAASIDTEDYAVLFELDRQRAHALRERPTRPRGHDCIVVDEAQELAPLELALLGRSLKRGGTLVVAGDAGQQVDPTAAFSNWDTTMADLGVDDYETGLLEASYRCPPDVTTLARRILDPARPAPGPSRAVAFAHLPTDLHLNAWLVDVLASLRERDPGASIAIVCRTPQGARRLARTLRLGLDVRLVTGGAFESRPGIDLTCVQEARGLEFDHVVVPDASATDYPDTPGARRALYVAVTRAIHQVALAAVGEWTPILADLAP